MRNVLLISLTLLLLLAGWSSASAVDEFYVIPAMRGQYAPVPKTGQTVSQTTGDDGTWKKGVASPSTRFVDNGNGAVTDKLTGLIWLKTANAFGQLVWADAISAANGLATGQHGLTDGSKTGDWRLPNFRELQSLIDYSKSGPALPANAIPPFTDVQSSAYWSSTSYATALPAFNAWFVHIGSGSVGYDAKTSVTHYVWCVRGGP